MTTPVKARVREEDYLATMTGEKPSLEFVNGEVYQKPLTKEPHLLLVDEILAAFRDYRKRAGGMSGPEGTVNVSRGADRRYRVPDAAYWGPDRPRTGGVLVPPTVAIEVRSEGQSLDELASKCREYRAAGVDACWLIDPAARSAYIFDATHNGEQLDDTAVLTTDAMPGFELPVASLWAALDAASE